MKQAPKPTSAKEKTRQKRTTKSQDGSKAARPANPRGRPPGSRTAEANDEPDEIATEQTQTRAPKYVQLAPRTRKIAQEQIDTWPQVSPAVLEQMVEMLRDAKKDIVNTQRDERRAMLADQTLTRLVRRLARQLSASRIPPQAKEVHFNIDKLTEHHAQLSREVARERHSKQLLKEQVKVAQHLLEADRENLERLKRNVKKWRTEWKHQEKQGRVSSLSSSATPTDPAANRLQLHPLLEDAETGDAEGDGPDDIGLKVPEADVASPVDLDSPDAELAPIVEQLRRSLENMQGNHEQVAGIDEAMLAARGALDDVLFRRAEARQHAAL